MKFYMRLKNIAEIDFIALHNRSGRVAMLLDTSEILSQSKCAINPYTRKLWWCFIKMRLDKNEIKMEKVEIFCEFMR